MSDKFQIFNEKGESKVSSLIDPGIWEKIVQDYGKTVSSISFILLNDEDLKDINQRFLDHDWYTDVITFNYADISDPVEGEIYCSIERIGENANLFEVSLSEEINRVLIHGILHLCGESDYSEESKERMRQLENHYLEFVDVPRGTK